MVTQYLTSLQHSIFTSLKYDAVRIKNSVISNNKFSYKEKYQSKIRTEQRTLVSSTEIKRNV